MREMTNLEIIVWRFMSRNCLGPEMAHKRELILAHFSFSGVSDRVFRQAVENLVTEHRKPICTDHKRGYYVARTAEELQDGVRDLTKKALSLLKRRSRLKRAIPWEKQEEFQFENRKAG